MSILHELVLKALLGPLGNPRPAATSTCSTRCSPTSAARGCDLACLVPPAGMEHVEAIASNLEKMPPKSTYFYPKLLSGLVLNPLAISESRLPGARSSSPARESVVSRRAADASEHPVRRRGFLVDGSRRVPRRRDASPSRWSLAARP